ncbi:NfeD family protein [Neptunicoccus sediminis]|uniref:NfeD family protein n=1 Tax=Neptunicoccus sediminis TaxID=1892596 RepID=UPI00084603E4|nr:NfeD family protein [Neptunicoccus sediminis]
MPFLDFLVDLSPWWWVAAAFVIGAVEMVTGTAVLIWIALAALIMAVVHALMPGLSGEMQITIFAALSVGLTFAGRWVVQRFGDGAAAHDTLNQRSNHLIGRTATVIDFHPASHSGAVTIEGMRWRAEWAVGATAEIGSTVRVSAAEGMVLKVEPV